MILFLNFYISIPTYPTMKLTLIFSNYILCITFPMVLIKLQINIVFDNPSVGLFLMLHCRTYILIQLSRNPYNVTYLSWTYYKAKLYFPNSVVRFLQTCLLCLDLVSIPRLPSWATLPKQREAVPPVQWKGAG